MICDKCGKCTTCNACECVPRKPGDVGIGVSATTEDMKVLYGRKAPKA